MKTAIPSAIGVAMTSARIDEYSVPQINGSAPNSPAIGSQVLVRQNRRPNCWTDAIDWRDSSNAIATTISSSASANAPVAMRKPVSPVCTFWPVCRAIRPSSRPALPALLAHFDLF
jgi:hypothetical protein